MPVAREATPSRKARSPAVSLPRRWLGGGVGLAVSGVAVWSTNAVGAQVAFSHDGLGPVLVGMTGGATAVLLVARVLERRRHPVRPRLPRRARALGLGAGVLGLGGTLLLQYVGFAVGPLLETNVISYGWPMFAAFALATAWRTRAAVWGLGFALLGFAGVVVMFSGSTAGPGHGPWGYLAALGSALCMTFYTLAVTRIRVPLVDVLLTGAGTALAVALVHCAATGADLAPSPGLLAAVYCGAGPVACGYLLWSRAMTASAGRLAPLGYAIPLLSTCLLLLTGQSFNLRTGIGAVLIITCTTGVLLADRQSSAAATPVRPGR